jgi:hypothetical protein
MPTRTPPASGQQVARYREKHYFRSIGGHDHDDD